MKIYAESSAVLAWLLGEPDGGKVREVLSGASLILSSDLTLIECDRVLIRAISSGAITEAAAADRRAFLNSAAAHWHVWHLDSEIVERARRPFPGEPVRASDAIHLAAALVARSAVPGLRLLSLDRRIRTSGKALGFDLLPDQCGMATGWQ
ncbi:MAG TPA: type II toxin-antitoxin system VapC family toxin [Acidobacteriota bacterium]|nr:type II toxin-antitoxin system VapC family toxin [Acidobacteriota bacterium]